MPHYFIFFTALLVLGTLTATAQPSYISDAEEGTPLEFVTISSTSAAAYVVTDAKGRADLSDFRGAEDIVLQLIGYETDTLFYVQLAETGFQHAMRPTSLQLSQVVVAATKWRQPNQRSPMRVSTLSQDNVALQNPQTAADLLGSAGTVFIQKSQLGGGSPMIRGFSANRLLYAVDGVRMNNAIFRSGNLQNVISLDPFAIERTEVLFGPGSVIYGSDAIGGVMSFETLSPTLADSSGIFTTGKAVARYASASQERTAHVDVSHANRRWGILTSFTSHQFDDLRMGRHGPEEYLRPFYVQRQDGEDVVIDNPDPLVQRPTGYGQINLMQKVRFQPNEDWNLEYGLHYSATTDYPRYDRLIRTRDGQPRSGTWDYGPQTWLMNHLSVAHQVPTRLYSQMKLRVAHQRFGESRMDRAFREPTLFTRTERVDALSANLDFLNNIGPRATLFYGLEVIGNEVASDGQSENLDTGAQQPGSARYPSATWRSQGAYASLQYNANPRWSLQTGFRYNRFSISADFASNQDFFPLPQLRSELQSGALTGSVGAVYRPVDSWSLIFNLSSGFRAPNVDDIGKVFDSEPGAVVVPNANLEPEYAYNAEFTLGKLFGRWGKIGATAYYTHLDQALVRRDFRLSGQDSIIYEGELSQVQAVQNAAQAWVWGIQLEVEARLARGLKLSGSFNYQEGEEELDDGSTSPSRHAAPWFGITRLTYRSGPLQLQAYLQYQGEKPFEELPVADRGRDYLYASDQNGNPYSPAWHTLNLKATYRASQLLSVSAGLENITDQRYRPYSSGIAGAGRNLILSTRIIF